jgi:Beta-galactosidase
MPRSFETPPEFSAGDFSFSVGPTARRFLPAVLILLLASGAFAENSGIPRGVFDLVKAGEPIAPEALSNPAVDGISIRQKWLDIEPSKGSYKWDYLDTEIARAAKAGKAVLLRIGDSGAGVPDWVIKQGAKTFSYVDRNPHHDDPVGTFPIFWDPIYLAEKTAMITALGEHFAGNAAVRIVAASAAGAHTNDWNVPHSNQDIAHWGAVGYTPDKLINSAMQTIETTMKSFPTQYVTIAVGRNGKLDPDPDYCARKIIGNVRAKYPGRLIVQKDNLSAKSAPAPGAGTIFQTLWESRPGVAGQMLWFSYADETCRNNGHEKPCDAESTLRQSIATGVGYGMKYIEVYQPDVVHLPGVIRYAHEALLK